MLYVRNSPATAHKNYYRILYLIYGGQLMKNTLKRILCLLLALIMTAGLSLGAAAQEDDENDGNDNDNETVEGTASIKIKGGDQTAYVGQREVLYLTCTVSPSNYNGGVSWKSSNEDVAYVDYRGYVLIRAAGKATVTATLDNGASDSIVITVREDGIYDFIATFNGKELKDNAVTVTGKTTFTLNGITKYQSGRTSSGASWGNIGDTSIVIRDSSAGEFTTHAPGTTTVEVLCPDDNKLVRTVAITVKDAPLKSLSISGADVTGGKASVGLGGTLTLNAEKKPDNTLNREDVVWESSDTSVATVTKRGSAEAIVTGVKKGTATITGSCQENGKTISASVTVTVTNPSADITADTAVNNALPLSGVYNEMVRKFTSAFRAPSSDATVVFTRLGSSIYGTLTTESSSSVRANRSYSASDVRNMYFVPKAVGSYVAEYEFTDGTETISGTITISVTNSKSVDITINLYAGSDYTFSANSTADKVSAASTISSTIEKATGSSYSYISLGYPNSTSSKIGTLYPTSKKDSDLSDYSSYSSGTSSSKLKQSPVSKLYFVPKKEGTYKVGYTAYNDDDREICSGDLIIAVSTPDNSTVTVTLDDDADYIFSAKTYKEGVSAASAIGSAVSTESKTNYSYITFGSVSSGGSVGTLYSNSDLAAVTSSRKYYRSGSHDYKVESLYFVPAQAGTYVRSFAAYDSADDLLLEGTLKIIVPDAEDIFAGAGEMDIYFNTTANSTLTLGESVFEGWFRQQKGAEYKLAYVTFDDVSRSFGTFRSGSAAITFGEPTPYYTESYTGSTNNAAKYLKNVSFTAGNTPGFVSVDFTCHGGTSSSSTGTKLRGNFCIFVTKNSVKSIDFDVDPESTFKLDADSFLSVYQGAMNSSLSNTKFYIKLLEIPSTGTLYNGYSSPSKTGTKLTYSNCGDYKFYVAGSGTKVSSLTYVPAASGSGSVKVRYLAFDADGDPIYVGTMSFNYSNKQTPPITCGADGYTFKLSDFYSSGDSDSVSCVTFRQPSTGVLMINYANGRGVPADPAVRLYTVTPSAGSYPITALTYIPKAGFSGNVPVDYTVVTATGKSRSGVLTISVAGRSSSTHFADVTPSGSGAWASDAIDFAYKWGLVSGTGDDTFSPDSTMSRAMLVTVLYRAAGSPRVTGTCPFHDVGQGDYFYEPVIWAVENGIASGTSATSFNPNGDVTREQVAAFLHRYAKYTDGDVAVSGSLSGYTDLSSVSSYAVAPMTWAVQNGYITSASSAEKVLSPVGNATRAQVAVMLHRYLTY